MSDVQLADTLHAFAVGATDLAAEILTAREAGGGVRAAAWMRAAREALEARPLAVEALADDERAATARVVQALREQAEERLEQRDALAGVLYKLARKFTEGRSATSLRIAAQIHRDLAELAPDYRSAGATDE